MNINDEPPISFTNDAYVESSYTIIELVGGRETCSDFEYSRRIGLCTSCDSCVGNEICTEDGQLVRVNCRLKESTCPLGKWIS